MNRGIASAFVTLTFAMIATAVTLGTSTFLKKQKILVSNPRAVSCPSTQCAGTSSCYPIGHYDNTSSLTCCAANTNCNNTSYNWATWGSTCNCAAPTPTRTRTPTPIRVGPSSTPRQSNTPRPTSTPGSAIINCSPNIRKQGRSNQTCALDICGADQYVTNSQQVVGTTRYCCCRQVSSQACCRNDGVGVTPCAANETKIRYVGEFTDNCASANNSYGNVSLCSTIGGPTSGHICKPPPTSTPTRTPTRTPTKTSTPGPNFSPTRTRTPTARLTSTPTIPLAQTCRQGNETYTLNQRYCDETSNVVKQCLGNNNWQTVNPNPCGSQRCTNDSTSHAYSCITRCEALEINGDNKLKIAFLPKRFTNIAEFRELAKKAKDVMKNTNLGSLAYKMNFYLVNDITQNYRFDKTSNDGGLICGADFSVLIDNPTACGNGGGGGSYGGPTAEVCGVVDYVIAHELGHSVTQLGDEYGDANSGTETIYPAEPALNCTKNSSCPKWSNMPDTQCVRGCGTGDSPPGNGFSNWYRPSEISIMRNAYINNVFNPPSLKAWEDYLKNYQ